MHSKVGSHWSFPAQVGSHWLIHAFGGLSLVNFCHAFIGGVISCTGDKSLVNRCIWRAFIGKFFHAKQLDVHWSLLAKADCHWSTSAKARLLLVNISIWRAFICRFFLCIVGLSFVNPCLLYSGKSMFIAGFSKANHVCVCLFSFVNLFIRGGFP
jgi:hypothetical protein